MLEHGILHAITGYEGYSNGSAGLPPIGSRAPRPLGRLYSLQPMLQEFGGLFLSLKISIICCQLSWIIHLTRIILTNQPRVGPTFVRTPGHVSLQTSSLCKVCFRDRTLCGYPHREMLFSFCCTFAIGRAINIIRFQTDFWRTPLGGGCRVVVCNFGCSTLSRGSNRSRLADPCINF